MHGVIWNNVLLKGKKNHSADEKILSYGINQTEPQLPSLQLSVLRCDVFRGWGLLIWTSCGASQGVALIKMESNEPVSQTLLGLKDNPNLTNLHHISRKTFQSQLYQVCLFLNFFVRHCNYKFIKIIDTK